MGAVLRFGVPVCRYSGRLEGNMEAKEFFGCLLLKLLAEPAIISINSFERMITMKKIIVILTAVMLLFAGCAGGSSQPTATVIPDTEAMKEAENMYTQYLAKNPQGAELMLCAAGGKFVLLRSGDAIGEYETRAAALTAAAEGQENTLYATFDCGEENMYICAPENRFMHISFDDTAASLLNLNNAEYDSLFDEPFFKWLKGLHDTYGAKFSMYVFADCLSDVTDRFAAEFAAASDWMKFGLHSPNNDSNYKSATYDEGKQAWNDFVANIVRITGTEACIDRIPRLHNFAGSKNAVLGMRDANCGALGFLAADDTRTSYYLSASNSNKLYKYDHLTDNKNGLVFLTTERRAEDNTVYSSGLAGVLTKQMAEDPLKLTSCIIFTHETTIYNAETGTFKGRQTRIEDACRFAFENNIPFAYPQEVTLSVTENDISK